MNHEEAMQTIRKQIQDHGLTLLSTSPEDAQAALVELKLKQFMDHSYEALRFAIEVAIINNPDSFSAIKEAEALLNSTYTIALATAKKQLQKDFHKGKAQVPGIVDDFRDCVISYTLEG